MDDSAPLLQLSANEHHLETYRWRLSQRRTARTRQHTSTPHVLLRLGKDRNKGSHNGNERHGIRVFRDHTPALLLEAACAAPAHHWDQWGNASTARDEAYSAEKRPQRSAGPARIAPREHRALHLPT